jgi:hypothetical protein
MGYLGIERQGREADHSPPSSVQETLKYTSTTPIRIYNLALGN